MSAMVVVVRRPDSVPVADGRRGVRSPSRYGTRTTPLAPRGASDPDSVQVVDLPAGETDGPFGDLRSVEGAHQRQIATGRVGETRHLTAASVVGCMRRGEDRAARAKGDGQVAGRETQRQRGAHVVTGSRTDRGAAIDRRGVTRDVAGSQDFGQPFAPAVGQGQEFVIDLAREG